jgi:membrane fusion protein (multidrug efflux system)
MVTSVVQQDVPIQMELVGQTKGSQDVDIRARVEGFLEDVAFTEGSIVRKGQVLYRIDPKSFEAALANAKADLATAEARLAKTTNDVNRYRPLVAQQAVSQQELDNAVSAQTAAQAQVEAQKAKVEQEQLNLGYTTVTSPIDGMVGTTQVKAGNLVGRGEATLLTTISELDPILFRAGISEAEYLRLSRRAEERRKERGGVAVPVTLVLADGTEHPYPGRLDVVERAVDSTTGTLTIQFKFPNPGGLLRPGQYGRAQFVLETRKGALLVPQRAVQELQNLYSVAVVGSDNKVQFRNVTVGPRVGSLWLITDGLKPGERVVVEGVQKVRDGAPVTPKDAPPTSAGSGGPEPAPAAEGK